MSKKNKKFEYGTRASYVDDGRKKKLADERSRERKYITTSVTLWYQTSTMYQLKWNRTCVMYFAKSKCVGVQSGET